MKDNYKHAIFAGGCFWCIEAAMEELDGVIEAINGYTGGNTENPTYEEVSTGTTGHIEATKVIYDPEVIMYPELLNRFWGNINPTDKGGQFADRGSQYETVIFYTDDEQKKYAKESKADLERSSKYDSPIVTKILPEKPFYEAEEEHQDYYKKRQEHYLAYKKGSGREEYIKSHE